MATNLVPSLASAIAQQEQSNPNYNNPGALTSIPGGWTGQTGIAPNGLVIFDNQQDGWNALYTQIQMRLYADMPIALLYQQHQVSAFSMHVGGQTTSLSGAFWNVGAWRWTK